ncbi:MAG: hypothetical protein IPP15_15775 [Saprospiraceae bacterium]|uniref:Lipoprotein n=1 Tax=Candidatus Opimibacter skivensis TaxID=2982028 RepID=A0A9D7XTK5_9BACT|nr:hypothetical protein [Candidatus Opimibacter skivensis]
MKSLLFLLVSTFLLSIVGCSKNDENLTLNPDSKLILNDHTNISSDSNQELSFRAAPVITSMGGGNASGFFTNGQWDGNTCNQGNYFHYYVINTFDPTASNNFWLINGSGFGSTQGTVLISSGTISLQILSWSSTQIKVRPQANWALDYKINITIKVKHVNGTYAIKIINILGMIKEGRGFGQCTWEAAYQRLLANKTIPIPAYQSTNNISVTYVPQKYDIVDWGSSHSAIIMTIPIVTISNGITTYTFQLRERNHFCDENAATTTKTFKKTSTSIIQGIKSANSALGSATKYFR